MNQPSYQVVPISFLVRNVFSQRKFILSISALAFIISLVVSLMIDNEYKASANLMPNESKSIGFSMLSGSGVGSLASSLFGKKNDFADRFYVLLGSESVAIEVIERFDLIKVYELEQSKRPMYNAMKQLAQNTNFMAKDEGNFIIEVWDKDPVRARDMAAFYIELLNKMNIQVTTQEAKAYREFIEIRYKKAHKDLDDALNRVRAFQEKHGIYYMEDQLATYFSMIGEMLTQKVQAELQVEMLAKAVSKDNSLYQKAALELDVINAKVDEILRRNDPNKLFINIDLLPEIAGEYVRHEIELMTQKRIMEFVVPVYEQAMLEEAKVVPAVSIVDAPRIPDYKNRPKRAFIVLGASFGTFLLCLIFVMISTVWQANRDYFGYLTGK